MRSAKLTVALATAGAGVICLAPGAAADVLTPGSGDVAPPGAPGANLEVRPCIKVATPGVNLEVHPCLRVGAPAATVRVGAPGANLEVRPCIKVATPGTNLEVHPCIKVGAPGGTNGRS
jgi:hypothetical protein